MKETFKRVKAVYAKYVEDGGSYLAAVISYYAFLSLFPTILLGVSILGFVFAADREKEIEWVYRISEVVPGLGAILGRNLERVVTQRGSVGLVGLVIFLWVGTRAIEAADFALASIGGKKKQLSPIRTKLHALWGLAIVGSTALIALVITSVVGGLRADGIAGLAIEAAALAVAFACDLAMFGVLYRWLSPHSETPWREIAPGTIFAALGWTALKVISSWYVARSAQNAGAVYGGFAAVVSMLALLFVASRLFIFGAEINDIRQRRSKSSTIDLPKQVTEPTLQTKPRPATRI